MEPTSLRGDLASEPDALQELRLDAVAGRLRDCGARSVLDLGCGSGELVARLAAEARFERIVGVDHSPSILTTARELLGPAAVDGARVRLLCASFTAADDRLAGFDAAALIETLEHVDPGRLALVERAVFAGYRPRTVIVTTPNREYNPRYGLAAGAMRHPDHRFEWDRARFSRWARGVGARNGYAVTFAGIGAADEQYGCPTQMALFRQRS
jgi:3' terminal RNA ribose 2'-O-methyltransferase Hen1